VFLTAIAGKLKRQSKNDFKDRQFEARPIIQAVSRYLHYPLRSRELQEMFLERRFDVYHNTIVRRVLTYAPLMERRLRRFRKPHCGSVRIKGQWRYLYRAIDKHGNPVDVLLTRSAI
jgi:transposase-like protein